MSFCFDIHVRRVSNRLLLAGWIFTWHTSTKQKKGHWGIQVIEQCVRVVRWRLRWQPCRTTPGWSAHSTGLIINFSLRHRHNCHSNPLGKVFVPSSDTVLRPTHSVWLLSWQCQSTLKTQQLFHWLPLKNSDIYGPQRINDSDFSDSLAFHSAAQHFHLPSAISQHCCKVLYRHSWSHKDQSHQLWCSFAFSSISTLRMAFVVLSETWNQREEYSRLLLFLFWTKKGHFGRKYGWADAYLLKGQGQLIPWLAKFILFLCKTYLVS